MKSGYRYIIGSPTGTLYIRHLHSVANRPLRSFALTFLICVLSAKATTIAPSPGCEKVAADTAIQQAGTVASTEPGCAEYCKFDVISIKPSNSSTLTSVHPTPDSYSAKSMTVRALVCSAYNLKACDLISGLPGWADSSRFDIEAKMDGSAASALRNAPENKQLAQLRFMLQSVLADRFRLTFHHAVRNAPVYFLLTAKDGVKLKRSTQGEATMMMVGPTGITATATAIDDLTESLSDDVGRIIVDKTGLSGRYDFVLKTAGDEGQGNANSEPSIFTEVQEQLGLKMVPGKAPIDTLAVDHIERPSAD
jgi:uncharacterized protein (TIGR03435 family)